MKQPHDEEPLLPPWVAKTAARIIPLAILIGIYVLMTSVWHVPPKILAPVLAVLSLAALIYFGGRFYKPFHVNRDGRCTARGAAGRESCRHYVPGARLGGGCGRLRENGLCRYVR